LNENISEVILYQTEDGETKIEVQFSSETVWLSLGQMVELFGRDKSVISRHIKNIFEEGDWIKIQLLQILQQLPLMERRIM